MNNKFNNNYDSINKVYNNLSGVIDNMYQYINDNPEDVNTREWLSELIYVEKCISNFQRGFAYDYADKDTVNIVNETLDRKEDDLSNLSDVVNSRGNVR